MTRPARTCRWDWLERVPYQEALDLQSALVTRRQAGTAGDTLLLLEHPPVITLGRSAARDNVHFSPAVLKEKGVELFQTGRGGDVTFHGPGQVVGYPVLDLNPDRRDVHRYIRDLEDVLIRTASDYGVLAARVQGLTGVWVGMDKLAAIGVRISRWVTSHGFALNVETDLSWFDLIVPCGIRGRGVTSLARLLDRSVPLEEVAACAAHHFGEVYQREMVRSTLKEAS
ncbi:MAG: lipoyl(octanoyl) transferase LipB [Acidobacteria bacterium]|nr:lipoyl(octanoyl) transferase LipB [Acidobacteriota bacterium]